MGFLYSPCPHLPPTYLTFSLSIFFEPSLSLSLSLCLILLPSPSPSLQPPPRPSLFTTMKFPFHSSKESKPDYPPTSPPEKLFPQPTTTTTTNDHQHHQGQEEPSSTSEETIPSCPPNTTPQKLLLRIDLHVIPFLCILYLLAFLDRVNISNANVLGLSEELGLERIEYNSALVIFFVPYIL